MEDNKELVNMTENVEEQATEELVEVSEPTEEEISEKKYTDADVDAIVSKKLARAKRKMEREFDDKLKPYLDAESVLTQGLGVENITDATNNLRDFYTSKGITISDRSNGLYSDNDIEILARAEAESIIDNGFEDVVDEVERLAKIGLDNMNQREKLVFTKLAGYRQAEENRIELEKLGVSDKTINSEEFKEFTNKLNPNMSLTEKYEMYTKYNKPKNEMMGSMKSNTSTEETLKDFYTRDEAMAFTRADFDKNPKLMEIIENSMSKWN